jgi:hypothetical protein
LKLFHQETFRTCSDIKIKKSDPNTRSEFDPEIDLESETEDPGKEESSSQKPKKKPHHKKDKLFSKHFQGKMRKHLLDLKVSLKNVEINIKKVSNLLNEISAVQDGSGDLG